MRKPQALGRYLPPLFLVLLAIFFAAIVADWQEFRNLSKTVCSGLFGSEFCHSRDGGFFWRAIVFGVAALPFVLVAEYVKPADPNQKLLSPGLFSDSVWLLLAPTTSVLLLLPMNDALAPILSGRVFTFDVTAAWPIWLQIVVAILLSDLIAWFHHWARHKVPLLWELHKLHHAPRELNYMSSLRLHPLDHAAADLIRFVPFFFLPVGIAVVSLTGWALLKRIQSGVVHGNLRMNFGPLKYILVTPQFHRVHHSVRPEEHDRNYGEIFVFWDLLFGTHNGDFDVYPETGIADPDYPPEPDRISARALLTPFVQILHPFRQLAQTVVRGVGVSR